MPASDQHAERPSSRATLADVARAAGVSASTASIAFSGSGPIADATRERIHAVAEELGYDGPDPRARSLRQGRSGVVGVVLESRLLYAFRDPVTSTTLDGIASALGPDNRGLLLLTDEGPGTASIESAAVDAVVLLGCSPRFDRSIEVFLRREIPVVVIEGPELSGVKQITIDNYDSSVALASKVRKLGHTRVAIITLPVDGEHSVGAVAPGTVPTAEVTADRLRGFLEVFPEAVAYSTAHNTPEDGRAAALEILDFPERFGFAAGQGPTAILAQADLLAVGALRACEERSIAVPGDISVTGFDGIRIDGLEHDLTTVVQPAAEKGRAAGRLVTALLDGTDQSGITTHFSCELHFGTTLAAPG
jgi:DNA-binding LacI/PurR family transcriptional regulator